MVTDRPLMSARRIDSRAPAASPGLTSKAKERQVAPSPSAANPALCKRGDSEWAIGLPITPTTRAPGPASARASSIVTGGPVPDPASGEPTALGQLLVGQLLGVGVREGHHAVLLHQGEIQPGA